MWAIGLDDDGNALPASDRPFCGARTRAGGTCRHKVVPYMARCRFHGGKSTGPRTLEGKTRIAEAQRQRWARWRQRQQKADDDKHWKLAGSVDGFRG
ncbi:HGGxSTG domain-containing protein [Tabrizicola sp.]|uniref:HGGxSTG domain-containing protein n=1 Tax=Tabrizicola sp. TaxID=2005166 RepID=UPI00345A9FF9